VSRTARAGKRREGPTRSWGRHARLHDFIHGSDPFLNLRLPEITRALLYPYRRLIPVRAAASEAGYQGGMFPWKSGSDEEALLAGGHAASSSPH
jgi:hypothetical protein